MACSYCGCDGHNFRSCGLVKRDDPNWTPGVQSKGATPIQTVSPGRRPIGTIPNCSLRQLLALCTENSDYLVHLYRRDRESYFEENLVRLEREGLWLLKATLGHGVRGSERPTINFFVANHVFAQGYPTAAQARGPYHGLMVTRPPTDYLARLSGYELAEVRVGHPNRYGVNDLGKYWRFDIGKHRYRDVAPLFPDTA